MGQSKVATTVETVAPATTTKVGTKPKPRTGHATKSDVFTAAVAVIDDEMAAREAAAKARAKTAKEKILAALKPPTPPADTSKEDKK